MPDLSVSEEQLRRLDDVCAELEAVFVDRYGTVRRRDALEYLLDTYAPPETGEPGAVGGSEAASGSADAEVADDESAAHDGTADEDAPADPEHSPAAPEDLTVVPGVGEVTAEALREAGFEDVAALREADPLDVAAADGVGEKQAIDIKAAVVEEAWRDDAEDDDGAADDRGAAAIGESTDASPADTLQQAMNLLEVHDDRWREGEGDEPYEVDLPDGSTEGVRTKDDVKRLLFKHWR